MSMRFKAAIITFLVASHYPQPSYSADQKPPNKRETFQVSLGASFSTFDTEFGISQMQTARKIRIDFEDDLKFDDNASFGWVGGYWRFADRHRV